MFSRIGFIAVRGKCITNVVREVSRYIDAFLGRYSRSSYQRLCHTKIAPRVHGVSHMPSKEPLYVNVYE